MSSLEESGGFIPLLFLLGGGRVSVLYIIMVQGLHAMDFCGRAHPISRFVFVLTDSTVRAENIEFVFELSPEKISI